MSEEVKDVVVEKVEEETEKIEEKTEEAIAVTNPFADSVVQKPMATGNYLPTIWNNPEMMKSAFQAAQLLAKSDMVPQAYRNKPANCFIAIDVASRMGVSPLMVMGYLNVIQGNAGWNGQGCISLINNSGRFKGILRFDEFYDRETGDFSCTAYAVEKTTGEEIRGTTIDRQMAIDCGWMDKNGSYWKKMPQQMAKYRAAAFFGRTYCPEALMGLYTDDELRDIHGYETKPETVIVKA